MNTDNVVALAERPQLVLDGFPDPSGEYFNLQSVKNLPTDRTLRWEQHVSGRFAGVMSGMSLVKRGGDLVRVYQITVLEATLDG